MIPTYDALMLPVLQLCAAKAWSMKDLTNRVADDLQLTVDERNQRLPSGTSFTIANRVHWAKTYLKQAGLLVQPKRGVVEASERGRDVLRANPPRVDTTMLRSFDEFRGFFDRNFANHGSETTNTSPPAPIIAEPSSTPEEQIATASQAIETTLRDALLARVLDTSPAFFEKLIIDLLLAMGYGGSRADAGERLGRSGDGGVDGVIREDQLGLDRIYLQAKRYKPGNSVGSEAVRAFVGAVVAQGAQKGVLITTSSFTERAQTAATQSGQLRLVLLDGDALTRLMIRFNIGVQIKQSIEIKSVAQDYFEDMEAE